MKILIAFLFPVMTAVAQDGNFWQTLAEVRFETKNMDGYKMDIPVFSKNLKSYNGKKIVLKGFVIPAGEVGGKEKFMLSSLPFNVCYFCGAAGPETVVQVETTEKVTFSTRAIVMEGILALNESNPDMHIYILRSAHLIKP